MMQSYREFREGLGEAYQRLELKLNQWGKEYGFDQATLDHILEVTPVRVSENWIPSPILRAGKRAKDPRAVINVGEGYVFKTNPSSGKIYEYVHLEGLVGNSDLHFLDEMNMRFLWRCGLTRKNGFVIPYHKTIGLKRDEENLVTVNPKGHGHLIVEDMSDDGKYDVTDIVPWHFVGLNNAKEFYESYQKHMRLLVSLAENPSVDINHNRHGSPDNLFESFNRMLLARIKDNRGEIIIGDLDNLVFDGMPQKII